MEIVSSKNFSLRSIFIHSWNSFYSEFKDRIRPDVLENVLKIILCRTGKLGFLLYRCSCGHSKKVPFTCKSRFCSSCGKIACDNWMSKVMSWSLPNMNYIHIVFTIPEQLRLFLIFNRKKGLDSLFFASKEALLQTFKEKFGCTPGLISVIHTFGSDIKWNPHVHIIITSGGLALDNKSWVWTSFIPYKKLRQAWKFCLLRSLRSWTKLQFSQKKYAAFDSLLESLSTIKWYVNVGKKLFSLAFTVHYIGRYAKRPVIAETRLLAFDGYSVSFSFQDKLAHRSSILSLSVFDFIGKLIRHIPNKHHRMIRYSGLFANRVKTHYLAVVKSLLNSEKNTLPSKPNSLSWRNRIHNFTGLDPLICPHCLLFMTLVNSYFVPSSFYLALFHSSA